MKKDRSTVFAGTQAAMQPETHTVTKSAGVPAAVRQEFGEGDWETIGMEFRVEQADRAPLHPEIINRITAAKALGVRVLKDPPRIGAFGLKDPTGEYYLSNDDRSQLGQWIDVAHKVGREIDARGFGFSQVKALGQSLAADPADAWFRALHNAKDIHAQRAVQRAFGEWADGDNIAAHIPYGLDIFCTADIGKSNAGASVLDPTNRAWPTSAYGVNFVTVEDLAASLP